MYVLNQQKVQFGNKYILHIPIARKMQTTYHIRLRDKFPAYDESLTEFITQSHHLCRDTIFLRALFT